MTTIQLKKIQYKRSHYWQVRVCAVLDVANIDPDDLKVNIRQRLFTPELVTGLYQLTVKARKPTQVAMTPIVGMLLENGR
jgi:hypothetical protein